MIDFSLRTTSPGVILAVLGVLLMFATITDKDTYSLTDSNTYLFPEQTASVPEIPYLPTFMPPEQILSTPTPTSDQGLP